MFSWDEPKNAANLEKHGVSFEVAVEIFADPLLVTSAPEMARRGELRWRAIGTTGPGERPLLVVYTLRDGDGSAQQIHLISARPLTGRELRELTTSTGRRAPQVLGHAASPGGRAWFGPEGLREQSPRWQRRRRDK